MRAVDMDHAERELRAALDVDDAASIRHWSRVVNDIEQRERRPLPSMLGAALWYAEHGLPVFPLIENGKAPLPRSRGLHEATTRVEQVRRWWTRFPRSNVAIATGHAVDVIDIDGLRGNISLARMLDENPRALDHVIGHVSTPRPGGRHLYVPARGFGNGTKLADGIDYRGRGGYVVAPPSYVIEESYEGSYQWTSPLEVERACLSVAV